MSKQFHIIIIILLITTIKTGGHFDNSDKSWSTHLYQKIQQAKNLPLKTISVSCPDDDIVLKACVEAFKQGYAKAILVGDEKKIKKVAEENNIDISPFKIINEPEPKLAGLTAVKLVHDNIADIYMKGLILIKDF